MDGVHAKLPHALRFLLQLYVYVNIRALYNVNIVVLYSKRYFL